MKAIILAAGIGKRISKRLPKCLIPLPTGKTIIGNQIEILRANRIKEIIVVVGFKKEFIMEEQRLNDDVNTVQYVLKVNGVPVSGNFTDRTACEMAKNSLPEEQRMLAEVSLVTTDGQQVLFG